MTHTQTQVNSAALTTSDNTPSQSARLASLREVTAQLRQGKDSERTVPFAEVTWHDVADSNPFRTFHAYKGRLHYDGLWWSSTVGKHVGYESLHERSFLATADADPDVVHISSQPLQVSGPDLVSDRLRTRIPDYLLTYADGSVELVDVTTPKRAGTERVAEASSWLRQACRLRGWHYRLWTDDDPVRLRNTLHVAGYRNPRLVDSDDLRLVQEAVATSGISFRQLLSDLPPRVEQLRIVPAALHLVWHGHLSFDWSKQLKLSTVLWPATASTDEKVA
ncbi:TnsA-like heteromeric transposase endonuclease subunit [Dietzia papillomatosis]|uniref:TnsA-like heteromeric transposase endonuclease subunit n=1 Tax=Dietzia papillomatosis TaxID=282305 RepID=UPI000B0B7B06|nr:TnsA-like heteromeric transposase endonuclease subunit [Dietzia papillomatosis]